MSGKADWAVGLFIKATKAEARAEKANRELNDWVVTLDGEDMAEYVDKTEEWLANNEPQLRGPYSKTSTIRR